MWLIGPDVGSAVNSRMPTADAIMARADLMEKWPINKGPTPETAERLMG